MKTYHVYLKGVERPAVVRADRLSHGFCWHKFYSDDCSPQLIAIFNADCVAGVHAFRDDAVRYELIPDDVPAVKDLVQEGFQGVRAIPSEAPAVKAPRKHR
jgi:hypothetical protein